jgi:hypothetical protein
MAARHCQWRGRNAPLPVARFVQTPRNASISLACFVYIRNKRATASGAFQTRSERATANGALSFVYLKFYVSHSYF